MVKIYALRIGNKYGIEYEEYLNSKLSNITWIHESFDENVMLQWNKLFLMNLDIDEPIVVIDIDILLINDYIKMINYPIERGEFLSIDAWWKDTENKNYMMNGGFQKYYPKDCKYIFEKFIKDPIYWQQYYIKNKVTVGPINGEQYFVEDSVKERLILKKIPSNWTCRMEKQLDVNWLAKINCKYPGEYMYLDDFNPDIKFVHYTHSDNRPY